MRELSGVLSGCEEETLLGLMQCMRAKLRLLQVVDGVLQDAVIPRGELVMLGGAGEVDMGFRCLCDVQLRVV